MIPNYKLFQGQQPQFTKAIETSKFSFKILYESDTYKTDVYPKIVCAVRRDSSVLLNFVSKSRVIDSTEFSIDIHARFETDHVVFNLKNSGDNINGFSFNIKSSKSKSVLIGLELSSDAPVGFYYVQLMNGSKAVCEKLSIFVLFNPLSPNDLVYVENRTDIDDHILREKMVIFSGSTKDIKLKTFKLSQFSIEAILTAIYYSNRMDIETRRDPELFTRLITSFLNSYVDKGLMKGSWNENHSGGVSPSLWKDNADIFRTFLQTGEPVKYGQCFNFSSCCDSILRCFGMLCFSISMLPAGHDNDGDGIITKYYNLGNEINEELSDMLWNYHCSSVCGFKRQTQIFSPAEASKYFLQHIDATPQSRSDGLYRCGPQPIELVKTQAFLHGLDIPYDAKVIYESINGKYQKVILTSDGKIHSTIDRGQCCKYIYTCDRDFEKLDLMRYYKNLDDEKPLPVESILCKVDIPSKTLITDPINYQFSISNTSDGFPTFVLLTAKLTDHIGHVLVDKPLLKISRVFDQKSLSMQSVFVIPKIKSGISLLETQIGWDLQVFDDKSKQLQSTKEFTGILPCFSGKIYDITHLNEHIAKISVSFKNELNKPIKNCKLVLKEDRPDGSVIAENYANCLPDSLLNHQFTIKITELGSLKIQLSILCRYGAYVLDTRDIIHGKFLTV